jgi:phosphate-selective porin OprO/OprP
MPKNLLIAGTALLALAVAESSSAGDLLRQAVDKAAEGGSTATKSTEPEQGKGEEEDSGVEVFWKDGKTYFKMKNAGLELTHRFQFRFNMLDPDDDVLLPGTTERGQAKGSFRIRRAKTTFEGWFWKPELTYELQLSWAGPEAGASTDSPLEDLYINWDASGSEKLQVRFGQFKVPLGRQENTTSIGLQFADRSLLTFEYTRGRDVGVMLHGQLADGKLEYRTGVFNGNPASRITNDNTKFQYNARVTWQPWGDVGYSEGDFESKDKPLFALAGQLENNNLFGATGGGLGGVGPSDLNTTILGGDAVFKFKGFSLFGEYFARSREPEAGETFDSNGYNVQAGFFLVRDRLELAFRYAGWDPTDLVPDNERTEIWGVVNYFLRGHRFKFQADFRQLEDQVRDHKTRELRVQAYVGF